MKGTKAERAAEVEHVLFEYSYLRSWGISRADCAERLHMDREALRYLLQRAAERGDPRSDWAPHEYVCSGTNESLQHHREHGRVA